MYKARVSFTAITNGKFYISGTKISHSDYYSLEPVDRSFFEKLEEESSSYSSNSNYISGIDPYEGSSNSMGFLSGNSSYTDNNDSSSNSCNSNDYSYNSGGGDSGGGGSSSDW